MKSYLALGDSYTIGEGELLINNFPNLLVSKINANTNLFKSPKIIAKTGWTTDELISAIHEADLSEAPYDLVSLLIGVNNQYRNYPLTQFVNEFEQLLKKAIGFSKNGSQGVFVVSIPDWGNTTFAADKDKVAISTAIDAYNQVVQQISSQYQCAFIDITAHTRQKNAIPDFLVEDGLHYNKEAHINWITSIYNSIKESHF